ncbi:MAG TPA: AMP-binding protein, partial [Miltoncostaeaceae bacterium]|nr:AMP-binding protein [Miltoncostaeaceae bacterium]
MRGLMMDGPLTLAAILRRAETVFGGREVVTRGFEGAPRRTDYAAVAARARCLAAGLGRLGIRPGDRVASLCMNHHRHLEAYFGVPAMGAILHTLNPRLLADDLALIVRDAGDRAIVVDEGLLPVLDSLRERVDPGAVIVAGDGHPPAGAVAFEALLAEEDPGEAAFPEPDEQDAAFLCYTSGTTGAPKGVLYSHRALVLHSLVCGLPDVLDVRETDTVMPVVPMFHVNAWGLPFTCALAGARQVLPGPRLDAASLLAAIAEEGVTVTAGVPTVWLALLAALDAAPGAHEVTSLRCIIVGGAAPPRAMMEGLERRHGLPVLHAWGMTEMTPVGTVSRLPADCADAAEDERYRIREAQGRPVPFVEIRARGDEGLIPQDGAAMGELEVRGPFVAASYFGHEGPSERFTDDGWFRTGDIVTIDQREVVRITDREKDLVKSGGEWISSVALENALMGHPDVAEAAVIAVPDPTWLERPLAVVVPREGA